MKRFMPVIDENKQCVFVNCDHIMWMLSVDSDDDVTLTKIQLSNGFSIFSLEDIVVIVLRSGEKRDE